MDAAVAHKWSNEEMLQMPFFAFAGLNWASNSFDGWSGDPGWLAKEEI